MARNFVDPNAVRFTVNDKIYVDAELYTGEKFTMLEPHRLFPVSGLMKYISLLDEEGNEQMIIRDLDRLMPESKEVILNCLNERYMTTHGTRREDRGVKIYLHAERTDTQLLHNGAVILATGSNEKYLLTYPLAFYAGTAIVEHYPVVLVDGNEDALAALRDE